MSTRRFRNAVRALALLAALTARTAAARLDIGDRLPEQPDPSNGSTPVSSGGGGACFPDPQQCLGVVGLACDGVLSTEAEAALVAAAGAISPQGIFLAGASLFETAYSGCAPDGSCVINAGSWAHDECCFANPAGVFCGLEDAFASGTCGASWDRAVHRVVHGLNWRRKVNQCRVDDDGIVDFAEYCAPAGTIVASGDRQKCCGRRTRAYRTGRDLGKAIAQAVVFDGTFRPRVCVGNPPATPPTGGGSGGTSTPPSVNGKPCTQSSQCGAGAICAAPSAGKPKVCLLI
jgi:hypothetical protein